MYSSNVGIWFTFWQLSTYCANFHDAVFVESVSLYH